MEGNEAKHCEQHPAEWQPEKPVPSKPTITAVAPRSSIGNWRSMGPNVSGLSAVLADTAETIRDATLSSRLRPDVLALITGWVWSNRSDEVLGWGRHTARDLIGIRSHGACSDA